MWVVSLPIQCRTVVASNICGEWGFGNPVDRKKASTFVLAFLHYEFRQNTLDISYLVKRISAIPLLFKKNFHGLHVNSIGLIHKLERRTYIHAKYYNHTSFITPC